MNRKAARLRRARRTRAKIREMGIYRLCVHRTPRHIYVQLIAPQASNVVASASTLDKEVRANVEGGGNIAAAGVVGKMIAERARTAGISRVALDRSGFKYTGRVKALADAAREHGLEF